MSYLSIEQVLQLHVMMIERYGGAEGVRDIGRLHSAVATQSQELFGSEIYPNIADKSAAIIRAIIADHPFFDGNKRTGMLCGLTLMELNGRMIDLKKTELEDFAVKIATDHLEVAEIATWLRTHSTETI